MTSTEKIILGTVQFGLNYGINNLTGIPDKKIVFKLFDEAFEKGVRILDTAEAYGNAHALIGEYQKSGNRFLINTKLKVAGPDIKSQVDKILQQLNADQIETFMFHSPSEFFKTGEETIQSLKELKQAGKINKIGISLYTNEDIEKSIEFPLLSVFQLPFNLLDNNSQRSVLIDKLSARKKEVHVRSVFLQGLFFKKLSDLPGKLKPLLSYLQKLEEIAQEEQVTMEHLALSYVASQKQIDKIIIGVDNPDQLEKNLALISAGISNGALKKIDAIVVSETQLLYPYNWN